MTDNEFLALKRRALSKYLSRLNDMQREAVFTVNADELTAAKLECLVDVSLEGRHSNGQVKLVLYREA